jgi:hypothetical protein
MRCVHACILIVYMCKILIKFSMFVCFSAYSRLAFYKLVCFLTWLFPYLCIWLFAFFFACLLFCVFSSCFLYACLLSDLIIRLLMYDVSDCLPSLFICFSSYSHLAVYKLVCFLTWLCAYLRIRLSDCLPSLFLCFSAYSHLAFSMLACFLTWLYTY